MFRMLDLCMVCAAFCRWQRECRRRMSPGPTDHPQRAGWLLHELWGAESVGRAEKASQRKAGSEGRAEVDSVVSVRQRGAKSVWREGTAHTGSLRLEGDTISIGGGEGPGRAGFELEVGEASLGLLSSF